MFWTNNISFPYITRKLCMYVDKNGWARNGNMCHLKIILNERSIYSNMYLFKRGGGSRFVHDGWSHHFSDDI